MDFDLGREFDVVLCMGSSIGYVASISRLWQTFATFAQHTVPGDLHPISGKLGGPLPNSLIGQSS